MSVGPHIIVVGDIVTDVVAVIGGPIVHASDTPAKIAVTGGGGGANTAAWLASAGASVTLCGVVGADEAGDARLAELVAHGVTCAIRRTPDAPTGSVVVLAERSERTMLTDRGANLSLTPGDIDAALASAPQAVHLHLSGYPLLDEASRPAARHALAAAAARGLTTSVDAASAGPLRRVGGEAFLTWVRATDVFFANADEARALVERPESTRPDGVAAAGTGATYTDVPEPAELARSLATWCGVAVVKLGADGAISCVNTSPAGAVLGDVARPGVARPGLAGSGAPASSAGDDAGVGVAAVSAAAVEARDPTGAGDAFAAGYLIAWLAGGRGTVALDAGAVLGARAVGSIGSRPPRLEPTNRSTG